MRDIHLAGVTTTLFNAGTHHVVTDVQFDCVGDLLVQLITQTTVNDRHHYVLDDTGHHAGCTSITHTHGPHTAKCDTVIVSCSKTLQ